MPCEYNWNVCGLALMETATGPTVAMAVCNASSSFDGRIAQVVTFTTANSGL